MIQKVMNAPVEQLLKVGVVETGTPITPAGEAFEVFVCDACGDLVSAGYGRIHGDRKLCIPCREAAVVNR
jgi:formylmethanofuran dehydrogenase subunit E